MSHRPLQQHETPGNKKIQLFQFRYHVIVYKPRQPNPNPLNPQKQNSHHR